MSASSPSRRGGRRRTSPRAALALTESLTRLSDRPDAVSDDLWDEVRRHYDEEGTATLLLEIALINVYNRLNVAVRQPAGAFRP